MTSWAEGDEHASERMQDKLDHLGSRWHALCGVPLAEVKSFQCPFSLLPMVDPVTASDGHTYSKRSLDAYFANANQHARGIRSIFTREKMSEDYTPNPGLRRALEEYINNLETGVQGLEARNGGNVPDTPPGSPPRPSALQGSSAEAPKPNTQSSVAEAPLRFDDLGSLRETFTKLDPLRTVLKDTLRGWEPPSVTVVGTRSAGKSTILERLAGLPLFPRDPEICTRLPIHVRLRQCDATESSTTLVVENVNTGEVVSPPEVIPILTGFDFVLSKTHDLIVDENNKLEANTVKTSTTKRIVLEVHHPYVPTIDLIDMPGLEAMNAGERTRTREILEKQVSDDKKRGNNGMYLLVVKAEGRFQVNDLASAFIDEQGLRNQCLGIFTNCDGMVPKYYPHLRTMIENPNEDSGGMVLGHGWVATMNCIEDFPDTIGSVERLKKQADEEATFFQSHDHLKALVNADLATCTALVKRLKTVYTDYLKVSFPSLPSFLPSLSPSWSLPSYTPSRPTGCRAR
jgi:hypothetical protein